MLMKPNSLCEFYVYTGIARVIYPSKLKVQQYTENSLGNWKSLGEAPSGKVLQWYGFNGAANRRRFIVNNNSKYQQSFRINVQRYTGLHLSGLLTQPYQIGVLFAALSTIFLVWI